MAAMPTLRALVFGPLFVACCWLNSANAQTSGAVATERLRPLDVNVNGSKSGTWLLLERGGALYAPRDAFDEWRVQIGTDISAISYKGQDYFPLAAVLGYQAKLNVADQSLELLFSPTAFSATRLQQEIIKKPVLSLVLPSAFFNYDLNYARSDLRGAPSVQDLGLLGEFGASNGWGVLTNSFASRNLSRDTTLQVPSRTIRLETTFTRDFPDRNTTLRLGDSVTRVGLLGRNVYFGGIQFGSNFSLSPGFVTQPIPVLTGLSAAPSTVELYVNDVLRQVSNVPTGPFAIDNLPTLTGNGDARLVVRDQLGRETIITQSFFTNGRLLAVGLHDWNIDAGSVRQDLGTSSGRYGPIFASGTFRHGYNAALTLEGRTEITSALKTLQVGAVAGLPLQLLGSAAVTTSHENRAGNGAEWLLGLEHRTLYSSTYLQAQGATERFRQLGQLDNFKPTKQQLAANWTYSLDRWGSVGVGYAAIARYDNPRVATYSANYSARIGAQSMLSLTANRVQGDVSATSVGLNLIFLLDRNRVASVVANSRSGSHDLYAVVSQNPTFDDHLGWRLLAGQQQNREREEAGAYYQGQRGVVTADVSHTPNQNALRFGMSGGLVIADGHFFATQRLLDSFAVAEVSGYGNVGVGLGSNSVNHTDADGIAMIPRLSPYQNNQIRLNAGELPINAEIDSIEQSVVPAWRSAVKVKFPVRTGRGALLKIVLDDGDIAPAGAVVSSEDTAGKSNEEFYVARRGEAFITGLQTKNRLTLEWNGQRCQLDVTLPAEVPDEFPRVGPLLCKGIKR